jgi:hypothetical protein
MPFRNRFANAAARGGSGTGAKPVDWTTFQKNTHHQHHHQQHHQPPVPTHLVLEQKPNFRVAKKNQIKTPKSPGNDSYESFGNNTQHSTESEWTENELSVSSLSKDATTNASSNGGGGGASASLRRRRANWNRRQQEGAGTATATAALEHVVEEGGDGGGGGNDNYYPSIHALHSTASRENNNTPARENNKLQARLASLFSSRATVLKKKSSLNVSMDDGLLLSNLNNGNANAYQHHPSTSPKRVGFVESARTSINSQKRSRSAPKKRSESPLQEERSGGFGGGIGIASSPTRSQTSGASSNYIRWPGTLDRHADIVVTTSSFDSRDQGQPMKIQEPTASHKFADLRAKFNNAPVSSSVSPSSPNAKNEFLPSPSTVNQRSFSFRSNQVDESFAAISSHDHISFKDNHHQQQQQHQQQHHKRRESTPLEKNSQSMDVNGSKQDAIMFETTDIVDLDIDPNEEEDEEELVDLDEIPDTELELDHPADFHLAAVISKKRNVPSPHAASHELNQTFPGALGATFSPPSNSSNGNGNYTNSYANKSFEELSETQRSSIDTSASLRRVQSIGKDVSLMLSNSDKYSSCSSSAKGHAQLTEDALKNNDRMSPIRSYAHGANIKGYRGFLDKTVDVPNLMDDSDSVTTASTHLTEKKQQRRGDFDLDSSDGMTSISGHSFIHHGKPSPPKISQLQTVRRLANRSVIDKSLREEEGQHEDLAVVQVGSSLSTIQTTVKDFEKRKTSKEFDANLTESDTDFLPDDSDQRQRLAPNRPLPSWPEHSGRAHWDGSSDARSGSEFSEEDLLQYAIDPDQSRLLVNKYRSMSNLLKMNNQDKMIEDSKKAFALFEMRSRIMESDIERGLDRKGGTVVVDDIVTTEYQQAAQRVRDAVIVSKAWRDGASPKDVRTAFMLTRNNVSAIGQLDVNRQRENNDRNTLGNNICTDDIEFSLLRCSSHQSHFTRGFDIFTVGDCQSILLKLTNEQCEVRQVFKIISPLIVCKP